MTPTPKNPRRKYLPACLPLGAFLVLVVLFAVPLLQGKDPSIIPSAMIGKPVPVFDLKPALKNGKGFSDADLKNAAQPAVVNVFASWCVSCRVEQQMLEKLRKESGMPLYGIDYKDESGAAEGWLKKYGNPFTAVGFDNSGRTGIDFGIYGVPETFIIDRKGFIRFRRVGPLSQDDLDNILLPLLKELSK